MGRLNNAAGLGMATVTPEQLLGAIQCHRSTVQFPMFGYVTVQKEWQIPSRIIQQHLIYLFVDGECAGRVDGMPIHLVAGNFMWLSPGVTHEFSIPAGASPFTLFFFKVQIVRRACDCMRVKDNVLVVRNAWRLKPHVEELLEELQMPEPFGKIRVRCLLTLALSAALSSRGIPITGPVLNQAQRHRLLQYIQEQISGRPTPTDLARVLDLSPDYFARTFQRSFGVSPRRWLVLERIRRAAIMLSESNLSVSQIAYSLGYSDIYLFSRQFKGTLGRSPNSYRSHSAVKSA